MSVRDDSDAKRKAAAERRRDEEGHWRGRLGNLASGLMAAGHPAAIEVTLISHIYFALCFGSTAMGVAILNSWHVTLAHES
jgi:hypothetical protein